MNADNLEFENRLIKKGDCLFLPELPLRNSSEFGMIIDDNILRYLKRLPLLFYVGETKKNSKTKQVETIKIKRKKTKQSALSSESFPIQLFKIVKVPKMYNVIHWFYNGIYPTLDDYNKSFDFFNDEMETLSRYAIELFQHQPKALQYLNTELNHLYKKHEAADIFILCKMLINNLQIPQYNLFTKFFSRNRKQDFINIMTDSDLSFSEEDAKAYYDLNERASLDTNYISSDNRVKRFNNPKEFILDSSSAEFASEIDRIKKLQRRIKDDEIKNDKRFIPVITQEIIDDLELTIFDTSVLEETNQTLYIFIDKYNNKRLYIEDFYYEFYISDQRNVIDNDYIVPIDDNRHLKYSTKSFEDLKALQFAINDNHKRFMKKGSF